jgi:hypothetical protein
MWRHFFQIFTNENLKKSGAGGTLQNPKNLQRLWT